MTNIEIRPLNQTIGAEIGGVDLRDELKPDIADQIHAAWLEHQVVFFRDQDISLEQHIDFARHFGDLHIHPNVPSHDDHPEVLVIHADESSNRVAGAAWHTDVSCDVEPPKGSILRLTDTPPSGGGDTLFASMYSAYEALSDTWKSFVDGLTAIHESEGVPGHSLGDKAEWPKAEHPVVRTHPETGRKALYVNSGFTRRVKSMTRTESRATLNFLFHHLENPNFQCRFQWTDHSIAMWDNRCVQHFATWDYFPETRHGYRVNLAGDRPR